jgi:hypothetical protein
MAFSAITGNQEKSTESARPRRLCWQTASDGAHSCNSIRNIGTCLVINGQANGHGRVVDALIVWSRFKMASKVNSKILGWIIVELEEE